MNRNITVSMLSLVAAVTLSGCDQKKATPTHIDKTSSSADVPCDFKGISVGDKMSPSEVMSVLGVKDWKMNPPVHTYTETVANMEKYGLIPSSEMDDWKTGPYCNKDTCMIPYGVSVGNGDMIPVSVFVAFSNGLITEVSVHYNELEWDTVLPILKNKYGDLWNSDNQDLVITDMKNKTHDQVNRILLNHKTGGINQKTSDKCQISATNYDIIETHNTALGMYQSIFTISLVSKNF